MSANVQERPVYVEQIPANGAGAFGRADAAIALIVLTVTLGIAAPLALHLNRQVRALDHEVMQSRQRYRGLAAAARFSEERRRAMARFRLEVDHYVQDVQSRPIVPWTTVVTEISQRRPQGVWITRVSGNGPRFRAQLAAQNPALIGDYLTRLQDSPCVDFAGRPGATMATTPGSTGSTQILGRVTGE